MTKTFLATVTFVVALASPVFAQSYDPDLGSGNIVPPAAEYTPGYSRPFPVQPYAAPAFTGSYGSYAQEPAWNGLPEGPAIASEPAPRVRTHRR